MFVFSTLSAACSFGFSFPYCAMFTRAAHDSTRFCRVWSLFLIIYATLYSAHSLRRHCETLCLCKSRSQSITGCLLIDPNPHALCDYYMLSCCRLFVKGFGKQARNIDASLLGIRSPLEAVCLPPVWRFSGFQASCV